NQTGVDRPDRCADDPIWFDSGFMHGLINAGLIGAERAAALQYQNNLAEIRDVSLRAAAVRGVAGRLAGAVARANLCHRDPSKKTYMACSRKWNVGLFQGDARCYRGDDS